VQEMTLNFPEKRSQVSIHNDGSFERLGCVLANTNLNVLVTVFYWFTLNRNEPNCPTYAHHPGSFSYFRFHSDLMVDQVIIWC
jgi:hypothetical protein